MKGAAKASRARAAGPRRRRRATGPERLRVDPGSVSLLGYKARKIARSEGRSYTTASGDYHLRYELAANRDESRSYYQDNALYCGVIDRAVDNIVRGGFGLQITTDDKAFNDRAERLRAEAWRRPEIRGVTSGLQVERLVCRDVLVAGDVGTAFIDEGRRTAQFQLIESERITDGRGGTGVALDRLGRPTEYQVADYTASGQISGARFTKYGPDVFRLIFDPKRISQSRGTPVLISAFPYVNRIEDACSSEALAMQVLARLGFMVTDSEAAKNAYATSRADADASNTSEKFEWAQRIHDLGSALVFHGPPGSKVEGIARNIPGQMFVPAVRMFLRLMGLPIGLPLELVLLDWSETSYSSAQAALEQAYTTFVGWQQILTDLFYDPVLNWQLDQWMADERLPAFPGGGAAVERTWIRPPFMWFDQLKTAQSWGVKMDRGLVTHAEACKAAGRDRPELNAARKAEFDDAIRDAQDLEKKYPGVHVDWRLFCGLLSEDAPVENPEQDADKPRKLPDGSEGPTGGAGEEPVPAKKKE